MTRHIHTGGIDQLFESDPPAKLLADAFGRREHPLCLCLCLCRPEGVPMYIARLRSRHILKRMGTQVF